MQVSVICNRNEYDPTVLYFLQGIVINGLKAFRK